MKPVNIVFITLATLMLFTTLSVGDYIISVWVFNSIIWCVVEAIK